MLSNAKTPAFYSPFFSMRVVQIYLSMNTTEFWHPLRPFAKTSTSIRDVQTSTTFRCCCWHPYKSFLSVAEQQTKQTHEHKRTSTVLTKQYLLLLFANNNNNNNKTRTNQQNKNTHSHLTHAHSSNTESPAKPNIGSYAQSPPGEHI